MPTTDANPFCADSSFDGSFGGSFDGSMQSRGEDELNVVVADAIKYCKLNADQAVIFRAPLELERDFLRMEILCQTAGEWMSMASTADGSIWQLKFENGSLLQGAVYNS